LSYITPHPANRLLSLHTDPSITGTVTPTVLGTITVPGGSMGPNGMLKITMLVSVTNSANIKNLLIKFGSFSAYTLNLTTSNSAQTLLILRNRGSLVAQVMNPSGGGPYGNSNSAAITCAIDTALPFDITVTATLANTGETITLNSFDVEVIR